MKRPHLLQSGSTGIPISIAVAGLALLPLAQADIFGTGPKAFTMDFVTIGNPGNLPGGDGGGVEHPYRMGTYEVSRDMVTKANSLGDLGFSLGYEASDKPALLTWNEAARFVNWLNTSSGYSPAYRFGTNPGDTGYCAEGNVMSWDTGDAGYNASNPYRNAQARYFLPTVDEWLKAGFYDPATGGYYEFPTGSDSVPISVSGGTEPGTAVFNPDLESVITGPADIKNAGGLSPYGTMAQGGNEWEFLETVIPGGPLNPNGLREARGGAWWGYSAFGYYLVGGHSSSLTPDVTAGFRVTAIPEPSAWPLAALSPVGLWLWRRRLGRQG